MNRPLVITAGIVILLSVVGLWVYLLAYGAPDAPREVFTNLGFLSPQEGEVRIIDPNALQEERGVQLALGGSELQQLTTRAVAGFAFASSSKHMVRYVERGTGHIFEINLDSGMEIQLSVTTIPQTTTALFSPDAETVVITTYEGYGRTAVIGTFAQESTLNLTHLPNNAENIVFHDNSTVYFTLSEGGKTNGYTFDRETLTRSLLFSLPIADVLMHWGPSFSKKMVQNKPTKYLEGYLYELSEGNTLQPLAQGEYGLSALVSDAYIIRTFIKDAQYVSHALQGTRELEQTTTMLDEKCVFSLQDSAQIWCASPLETPNGDYLENWYKGIVTSEDSIWVIDLEEGSSTLVGNLPSLSGRTLDISDITIDRNGELLLMSNKLDGTLWLYMIKDEY
jgi:hypothetical protein